MRTLIAATLGVVLLAAPPARAQVSEARAQAQALFDEGAALMQKKDYAAACPKLEASLQRFDGIGTRGKLAQCYEALGRVASAWAMYREVVVLAGKAGEEHRAAVARDAAAALEPRVPRITLAVPEAARIDGLELRRNGVLVSPGAWNTPIPADPGEQRIEATAPGYKPWIAKLELKEGSTREVVVPALKSSASEPTAPATSGQAPPSTVPSDTPSEPSSSPPWKPIALVSAGVGVVSLGIGTYFGLRASSKWNGAFDDGHCRSSDDTCTPTGQEQTEDARDAAVLANVFFGAGIVLTAGGAALWFLAPEEPAAEARGVRVVPVAQRDRGGLWVQGSF